MTHDTLDFRGFLARVSLPFQCPFCGQPRKSFELGDSDDWQPVAIPVPGPDRVYVVAINHEPGCEGVA